MKDGLPEGVLGFEVFEAILFFFVEEVDYLIEFDMGFWDYSFEICWHFFIMIRKLET